MFEHIFLAIAVIGWAVTYWLYTGLEETYRDRERRTYNNNVRELDRLHRRLNGYRAGADYAVRAERCERELREARETADRWQQHWKDARQMRLMELLGGEIKGKVSDDR